MSITLNYAMILVHKIYFVPLCITNVNDNVDVCRLKMEEEKKELEERLSSPAALYTNEGTYVPHVYYMYKCTMCIKCT